MKKPSNEKVQESRQELFSRIDAGTISIGDATRLMRKTIGMNRKDYAEKILKISMMLSRMSKPAREIRR